MSLSLRDQLLKAGLVTEKQVKQVELQSSQQQFKQNKKGKSAPPPPAVNPEIERAKAEKAAKDLELNRKKQEKAERRARSAAINQMVEQNRIPRVESDDFYNFVDGNKIHRIAVNGRMREQIVNGELLVARFKGFYALVPAATAARVREIDANSIVPYIADSSSVAAEDDPYKEFVVPDDLTW
jgi:uncharacterized protein